MLCLSLLPDDESLAIKTTSVLYSTQHSNYPVIASQWVFAEFNWSELIEEGDVYRPCNYINWGP